VTGSSPVTQSQTIQISMTKSLHYTRGARREKTWTNTAKKFALKFDFNKKEKCHVALKMLIKT